MVEENDDMIKILDDIKNLNDSELYESAELLGSFVVSKSAKSRYSSRAYALYVVAVVLHSNSYLEMDHHHQSIQKTYRYADSLFGLQEFRRSQKYYKMALKSKKYVAKSTLQSTTLQSRLLTRRRANSAPNRATPAKRKKTNAIPTDIEAESEVSLRYKIHKCLIALGDDRGGLSALEKIPSSSRDSKILIAMGKLYESRGVQRQAVRVYRQALSMNPKAVGALLRLQHLGASKNDVSKFLSSHHKECAWIETFAMARIQCKENHHPKALELYEDLNKSFPSNPHVLRNMGLSYLKRGDTYVFVFFFFFFL